MATIMECIERIPSVMEGILERQGESFRGLAEYVGGAVEGLDEVVFIGSGTSNTAAMTSQAFVEKVSGLRTRVVLPNDYIREGRVYNPHALHVFTSQTGTSTVVCRLMERMLGEGLSCVALTEGADTPLARLSPCHVCLNCGKEEFLMRTIGYAASVLNHMLLGLELGLARSSLSPEGYEGYRRQAMAVPDSHRAITAQAREWFERNKRQIMRSGSVIFTGAGALYGVALEAAVKFWEMPQVTSVGYELEEGMHGPNYGYDGSHCLVILNDGGIESKKALSLGRYVKEVLHNGFVVGAEALDGSDLVLDLKGGEFACLEFSAVPQVMAYCLAVDMGRDISRPIDHSDMYRYFNTHG